MIKEMKIEKLFGRFDYDIEFKLGGVTILTGPNGYGKSTILKCLEILGRGSGERFIRFFYKLNFKKIEISLDNSTENIIIEKTKDALIINKENNYSFSNLKEERNDRHWNNYSKSYFITHEHELRNESPEYIRKILRDEYFVDNKKLNDNYSPIKNIYNLIGPIYFIKEQRLIMQKYNSSNHSEAVNVIEELPIKLKNLISDVSNNYSTISNKLDNTYPYRLFRTKTGIDKFEYEQKMNEMISKFDKLNKYDISEMQYSGNVLFKDEHAKALKVYFEDFDEKYKVYEDFITKLDLFTDIVNSRLSFKNIKISREKGIIITDEGSINDEIKLNELSSGEKQEVVLFYDLIFEVSNNVVLLIDEPEISLHISWQKMFLDDLLRIVEYKGLKVIVATHSPQIINNHWDIQVDLGDLYGRKFNKV